MRYFFLTFQTETYHDIRGTYKFTTYRFMVARLGNRWAVQAVLDDHVNAFRGSPTGERYFSWSSSYSHVFTDCLTEQAFLSRFADHVTSSRLINVNMTEMTTHQRAYLLGADGFPYYDRLLDRLYYSSNTRRIDEALSSIRSSHRARVRPVSDQREPSYVVSRGGNRIYGHSDYQAALQTYADLGKLVREAIRDDDADALEEFFIEGNVHENYFSTRRTFDSIYEALRAKRVGFHISYCDCGHFEHDHDTHDVRGDTWCESCFNDDAVYVEDRDEYWPRDDAYWSENEEAYYSYDRDEDDDDSDPSELMDYSTNVLDHLSKDASIKSSPHGEFLMGIEFEMVTTGRVRDAVSDIRDQLGVNYCVCKYDGSLSDGGLEVVTAPRGLPEHIKRFKGWTVHSDYRAWDRKCCGMHIHIDSHAFTQMTLGKFIMFINDAGNTDFIRKIAGRHPNRDDQARTYAAAEDQQVLTNPSKAVKGKSYERYRMVNLQNLSSRESRRLGFGTRFDEGRYDTVELRIFRASLKKERLLAQIEFTHAAVMFCRVASWRELNQSNFLKWLKGAATGLYPHLSDWYGVRRRVSPCLTGKQSTCQDQPEPVAEGD